MANCSNCNGCSGSRSYARVGALDTVCRRNPYYTGSCPSAPCNSSCNTGCNTNCNTSCSCACGGTDHCHHGWRPGWHDDCHHPWRPPFDGWEDWPWPGPGFPNPNPVPPTPPTPNPGPRPIAQGVFTAAAPLTLDAGATVPLVPQNVSASDFTVSNGVITIRRPGLYYVSLAATVPDGETAATDLLLTLDGQNVAPSGLDLTTGATSGQGLFYAAPNSQLTLATRDALDLTGTGTPNVVTLSLVRVR